MTDQNPSIKVQPFKSSTNIKIESKRRIVKILGSFSYEIEPNESTFISIPFERTYKNVPIILYSVTYNSKDFQVNHHISEKTCKDCTIAIENLINNKVNITIDYKINPID